MGAIIRPRHGSACGFHELSGDAGRQFPRIEQKEGRRAPAIHAREHHADGYSRCRPVRRTPTRTPAGGREGQSGRGAGCPVRSARLNARWRGALRDAVLGVTNPLASPPGRAADFALRAVGAQVCRPFPAARATSERGAGAEAPGGKAVPALLSGAASAVALAVALGDGVHEARGVDRGVDGGGADVGVAGELADDGRVGAGVGEMGAEGVAQDVR